MTKIQRLNAGFLLYASAIALLSAQAAHADSWLGLGDSLSDAGNAYALTGGLLPDLEFFTGGRFSDGPVWFDRSARDHGLLAEEKAVQTFGITRFDDGDRLVGGLSGGERQSPAIARAVHFGARFLILDEPITDLMAGGASMSSLEAEIEGYRASHDGHPPQVA